MDQSTPIALTILASAFGGAIITGLTGFVTHALTGRREQRKWLLDLKYKAYSDRLEAIEATRRHLGLMARARVADEKSKVLPSSQEVHFLASKDVEDKLLLWSRSYSNYVDIVDFRVKAMNNELSGAASDDQKKKLLEKYQNGDGPLAFEFKSHESITDSCATILSVAMKRDLGLKVGWRTRWKLRNAKSSMLPSTRPKQPQRPTPSVHASEPTKSQG